MKGQAAAEAARDRGETISPADVPDNTHGIGGIRGKSLMPPRNRDRDTRWRLYDCRHAAITEMYVSGLPDQVIRSIVGWTPSSRMPDIYVHVSPVHIRTALARLEEIRVMDNEPAWASRSQWAREPSVRLDDARPLWDQNV